MEIHNSTKLWKSHCLNFLNYEIISFVEEGFVYQHSFQVLLCSHLIEQLEIYLRMS